MIVISDELPSLGCRYRDHMRFAMADETKMGGELIGFGLEDSGSDFSFGCFGISGEKYPMEEMDEWDPEEVRYRGPVSIQRTGFRTNLYVELSQASITQNTFDLI